MYVGTSTNIYLQRVLVVGSSGFCSLERSRGSSGERTPFLWVTPNYFIIIVDRPLVFRGIAFLVYLCTTKIMTNFNSLVLIHNSFCAHNTTSSWTHPLYVLSDLLSSCADHEHAHYKEEKNMKLHKGSLI